jgi:hypothetical protein
LKGDLQRVVQVSSLQTGIYLIVLENGDDREYYRFVKE